jgi:hypothetical protein
MFSACFRAKEYGVIDGWVTPLRGPVSQRAMAKLGATAVHHAVRTATSIMVAWGRAAAGAAKPEEVDVEVARAVVAFTTAHGPLGLRLHNVEEIRLTCDDGSKVVLSRHASGWRQRRSSDDEDEDGAVVRADGEFTVTSPETVRAWFRRGITPTSCSPERDDFWLTYSESLDDVVGFLVGLSNLVDDGSYAKSNNAKARHRRFDAFHSMPTAACDVEEFAWSISSWSATEQGRLTPNIRYPSLAARLVDQATRLIQRRMFRRCLLCDEAFLVDESCMKKKYCTERCQRCAATRRSREDPKDAAPPDVEGVA